jgi:hypothetical protein
MLSLELVDGFVHLEGRAAYYYFIAFCIWGLGGLVGLDHIPRKKALYFEGFDGFLHDFCINMR